MDAKKAGKEWGVRGLAGGFLYNIVAVYLPQSSCYPFSFRWKGPGLTPG